jgi:hypothetical protein
MFKYLTGNYIGSRVSVVFFFLLALIMIFMFVEPSVAQCPMCKASAESSIKGGSKMALGLNKGILYLLMMPYLLFSIIFLLWYRNYRQRKTSAAE